MRLALAVGAAAAWICLLLLGASSSEREGMGGAGQGQGQPTIDLAVYFARLVADVYVLYVLCHKVRSWLLCFL